MRKLICSVLWLLAPSVALAASQFTPAAVNGTIHLTTPATLADKQSSVFLSDTAGSLNVNIAGASIPSLPVTVTVVPFLYSELGKCKLTVTGATAISTSTCAGGVPATARYMLVSNEGSSVRWDSLVAPTTTSGQILGSGTSDNPAYTSFGPSANSFIANTQWIERSGTGTGTLNITFYSYQ